jgi:hypothetical protein
MRAIHTRGLLGLIMKPQRMSNTSILWALCIPYVPLEDTDLSVRFAIVRFVSVLRSVLLGPSMLPLRGAWCGGILHRWAGTVTEAGASL